MVPVDALQHLDRHPKEARDLPEIATVLHRPSRRCVPQDVRGDVVLDPGPLDGGRERLAHGGHRLAVPFDDRMLGDAKPMPAPQVRKQPIRQPHWRLALLGLARALRPPIEHTAIQIDMAAPDGGLERRAADRSMARTGVEPGQDEPRNVLADIALGARVAASPASRAMPPTATAPPDPA